MRTKTLLVTVEAPDHVDEETLRNNVEGALNLGISEGATEPEDEFVVVGVKIAILIKNHQL